MFEHKTYAWCNFNVRYCRYKYQISGNYLSFRNSPGRPRVEEQQPELLKAICDIALHGSAACSIPAYFPMLLNMRHIVSTQIQPPML